MNIGKIIFSAAVFAATCCPSLATQEKVLPTKKSCLAFVEEFYGWYVPKARDVKVNSIDLALKERRSAFSTRLITGVEAVEEDAARNQEVGLDIDWILASQDPGDPGDAGYIVGKSKLNGNVCRVDVSRPRPDGKGERVVPELRFEHGRWLFVNFHYPGGPYPQSANLLSLIKAYLESASGSPQKPH